MFLGRPQGHVMDSAQGGAGGSYAHAAAYKHWHAQRGPAHLTAMDTNAVSCTSCRSSSWPEGECTCRKPSEVPSMRQSSAAGGSV